MWAFKVPRFLWSYLCRARVIRHLSNPNMTTMSKASGGTLAATLYACTLSAPATLGAAPEDAERKAHHNKSGKGFVNPWDSWKNRSARQVLWAMIR